MTFKDLPLNRADFSDILAQILPALDWAGMIEDARFWVEDMFIYDFTSQTSVSLIADATVRKYAAAMT